MRLYVILWDQCGCFIIIHLLFVNWRGFSSMLVVVWHYYVASPVLASFVHAKCMEMERVSLWDDLLMNKASYNYLWIVAGGFILILNT